MSKEVKNLSKSETKALHKEICDYYLENGWRQTLSQFKLSPEQGSEIIPEPLREKHKLEKKAAVKAEKDVAKAAKKAARAEKKAAAKAEKASGKPEKAPKKKVKAEKVPKAEAAPKMKAEKAEKAPKMKSNPAPKVKAARKPKAKPEHASNASGTLDFLVRMRKANKFATLDDAIAQLAEQVLVEALVAA